MCSSNYSAVLGDAIDGWLRLGFTLGNEFSDHEFEPHNYLNLEASKRALVGSGWSTCSIEWISTFGRNVFEGLPLRLLERIGPT